MTNTKRNRNRDRGSFWTENKILFLIILGITGVVRQLFILITGPDYNFLWALEAVAIITTFIYLYLVMQEDTAKRAKDEFKDLIDNKRSLKILLIDILNKHFESSLDITEQDFYIAVKKWQRNSKETNKFRNLFILRQEPQSFIDDIGIESFAFLLLTKAENAQFITIKTPYNHQDVK